MSSKREMQKNFLKFISRYTIYVDGKAVHHNVKNWKLALSLAKMEDEETIFGNKPQIVEILNVWTGEIISLKEAQERVQALNAVQ